MAGFRLFAACMIAAACAGPDAAPPSDAGSAGDTPAACDASAARAVVERFGQRLNDVSVLAPDSIVTADMQRAYGPLVTPGLLDTWLADPASAPGRQVSSPWPERIEVQSVVSGGAGECRVAGHVVYVTSADTARAAARESIMVSVRELDGWRIAGYDLAATPDEAAPADTATRSAEDPAAATDVIRQYYAAISAGDFRQAYALWTGNGSSSGQTFDEFAAGFAQTARVQVEVGTPGRIGAAAGSRYIVVPVTIDAVTQADEQQRFTGTYTLRRSVVDGATAEQRTWRIHSADIRAR